MHGLIGGFLERINRGLAPMLYGGKQSNDFTYIKDIATANVLALTAPWDKWRQVYNIGTGEELSTEAAGRMVCDAFGYKGQIETKEQRTVDPDRFVFDCSKAVKMLGFKAKYDFKSGLEDMKNEAGIELQNMAPGEKRAA
jgi:nucleoside-diphosphate-sugar epimerase